MTIKKLDIANHLTTMLKLKKKDSKKLVNNFFIAIENTLLESESVALSGFGNFKLLRKKARAGCNPKTGEYVEIAAMQTVSFKAGPKLTSRVNNKKFIRC